MVYLKCNQRTEETMKRLEQSLKYKFLGPVRCEVRQFSFRLLNTSVYPTISSHLTHKRENVQKKVLNVSSENLSKRTTHLGLTTLY